jgi:CDP-diacylglycerol--serine O-phosphatidyltransferase
MTHDGLTPLEPLDPSELEPHGHRRRRRRRIHPSRMIRVVPSLLTLGNLICGFSSIFYASRAPDLRVFTYFSPLTIAAALIFLGMVFDALDGRVARMTRQTSELGEQLDSMSDMTTFGIAPAFMVVQLVGMLTKGGVGVPFLGESSADTLFGRVVFVIAAVYAACTALRLARFNVEIVNPEEADHMSFKGLPSPAAAGTVASLVLLHESLVANELLVRAKIATFFMVATMLLAAIAMVSTLRYPHLMNKYLRGRAPVHYLAAALIIGIPFVVVPQLTLAIGCVSFALFTPIATAVHKLRRKPSTPAHAPTSHHTHEQPRLKFRQ